MPYDGGRFSTSVAAAAAPRMATGRTSIVRCCKAPPGDDTGDSDSGPMPGLVGDPPPMGEKALRGLAANLGGATGTPTAQSKDAEDGDVDDVDDDGGCRGCGGSDRRPAGSTPTAG